MDYMMHEMDGLEATRLIRSIGEETAKLPIVALTASVVKGMERGGMDDFLAKPIELKTLGDIWEKWLPAWARGLPSWARWGRTPSARICGTPWCKTAWTSPISGRTPVIHHCPGGGFGRWGPLLPVPAGGGPYAGGTGPALLRPGGDQSPPLRLRQPDG